MNINTNKLRSINGYAKERELTTQRVYQMIKEGKLKYIQIDKIKLIIVDNG